MSYADPRELELLKSVLAPLLEDFQYWFSRAQTLLEAERSYIRLLAEVRQQATGNRQQWEELEFFGIKLI
jgi:hypothetical protein